MSPAPRRGAALVFALGTTQTLAWASSTYLPAILAAPIARDLGVSTATVFGAFSVALLVMALIGPAAGRAIDLRGGRPVLILSNLVLAGGLLMLAGATGVAMLFAAWCVLGAGMALGLYDAAFATLVRIHGEAARKSITGITLIAGFASTVGWPLSAFLDAQFGWRTACLVWAALHLLVALPLNWRCIPPPGPPPPPRVEPSREDAQAARRRHRRTFMLVGIFFAATAFVTSAFAAHLPGILLTLGAGAAGAVLAASLLGPAQVAARMAEFGVATRFNVHPLQTARVATALHPLAALLLGVIGGPPAMAAVFALMHGAGNGMITIARGTLPLALFGPTGYGLQQGVLSVAARTMQALAPFLFGLVLEQLGGRAALLLSGGVSLVALTALFLLRAETSTAGTGR